MIDRRHFIVLASGTAAATTALGRARFHASASRVRIVGLKVDHIDRPLGLETEQPRLSWHLESGARGMRQSAYRIWVASSEAALEAGEADLWDSGKVRSHRSFGIAYGGRKLASRQRCWWRVQIWDDKGAPSQPSELSGWEMGLLEPSDWTAQWLAVENAVAKADREAGAQWIGSRQTDDGAVQAFRFAFRLDADALAGVFFADTPRGSVIRSIWIDGRPIPRAEGEFLAGAWRDTGPLGRGAHVLAFELKAAASYAASASIELFTFARLELEESKTLRIGSGPGWKTALAPSGRWYEPGYNDSAWTDAEIRRSEHPPWPAAPAMHLRRIFFVNKKIVAARLYATALGTYEARLNGDRVGDALLTPEFSQYSTRVLYRVHDVTAMVESGHNVLGLTVGDGWYASYGGRYRWGPPPRRVCVQLELTFADGSREIIATGPGWRIAPSPILAAESRQGETYDARLEQPGWDCASFDDAHWQDAWAAETPSSRLVAQTGAPIRCTQLLTPQAITEPKPGAHVVDFGQNFAGRCRLHVVGPRGTRIELRFAEVLSPSGEIDQSTMGIMIGPGKPQLKTDVLILSGAPAGDTFEPHFVYRGFRYVQITGLSSQAALKSIEGVVIHNDLDFTGRLRTDSPLLSKLWQAIFRTQRSNVMAVFTDNPTREQCGWLGDAGIFWDAATFNMDMCSFTWRLMDNVADSQAADGAVPQFVPTPTAPKAGSGTPPAWGDAAIILPWTIWRRYGDTAIIARYWEVMSRYLQFILDANPDYVWRNKRGMDWGDWLAVDETPHILDPSVVPRTNKDLIGTAYWAHSLDLLAQMAEATERSADARRLRALFEHVREAFNTHFVKPDGAVGSGSQTSQVLALAFGLLPAALRHAAAARLAADIRSRGIALSTGIVGTQFILDVLADAGYVDLAYGLLLRTDYPSWGHMIESGATTIWENWRALNDPMRAGARNQPALGSIGGFLYRRVAGIDVAAPGFEKIVIRPLPDARIKRGGGDYDSVMGRISTDWQQHADGAFSLKVTIPANASAHVHLPAPSGARIREGRCDVTHCRDLRLIDRSDREIVLEVGAGSYSFTVSA